MKRSFALVLLALFAVFFGCFSQSQTPARSARAVSPAAEFDQLHTSTTSLRIKFAKRTEWYHDFQSELRAKSPEKDAVLVLLLDGVTPEEFQKIRAQQPTEGIGSIYLETGNEKRVFGITISGEINGKAKIMLATTVPRSAAEVRIVIGDQQAVLRLNGPVVQEITSTD